MNKLLHQENFTQMGWVSSETSHLKQKLIVFQYFIDITVQPQGSRNAANTVTCSTSLVWNPFSQLKLISTLDYILLQLYKLYTVHSQVENTIKLTITILTTEVTSMIIL